MINTANNRGQTALMLACRGGHVSCAKQLLARGADAMVADAQVGPLSHAWWIHLALPLSRLSSVSAFLILTLMDP